MIETGSALSKLRSLASVDLAPPRTALAGPPGHSPVSFRSCPDTPQTSGPDLCPFGPAPKTFDFAVPTSLSKASISSLEQIHECSVASNSSWRNQSGGTARANEAT